MTKSDILPKDSSQESALRMILEGTAAETGQRFFAALVESLAKVLDTDGAWVTEYVRESRVLRSRSFWHAGEFIDEYDYNITGTPCEQVIDDASLVLYSENIISLFPEDPDLEPFGAVSYMGVPLLDTDGEVLGHLAVQDTKPMPEDENKMAVIKIFAARASAELQRLRAEADVRDREQKLGLLVDSAMDGIIELDSDMKVTRVNPAAEKVFRSQVGELVGQRFSRFLTREAQKKLAALVEQLHQRDRGQRFLWIPGGLKAVCHDGNEFQAEATLSQFEMHGTTYHTLILRNVNERLESERRIHSLTVEAEYLKEEINALHDFHAIIARCRPMLDLLREIEQVAETDTTVLIQGETGTGKELVARALHGNSRRSEKPLIKVNCAAIPTGLIESELFGHEKGAFTGATTRREGRFTLADGGTIFLDEVGELGLDLQAKLLRVLQEGEYEPVGSSKTRSVDVRVLAATNRNLAQEIENGGFREDLFYRLNVFPVHIPPLRERGDDIVLLGWSFAQKVAKDLGRTIEPPTDDCKNRLLAYGWPGNVRELQNVIERAVITSRDGHLNLDRALPQPDDHPETPAGSDPETVTKIRTIQELQDIEKKNIVLALEACNWRISGQKGAAHLIGVPPSTLSSRIKALGIRRP